MTQLLVIAGQAIRSRPWASLALLLTAAMGIAAAGVAPLWANAAEDSLITQTVRESTTDQRLVTVTAGTAPTDAVSAGSIPEFAEQVAVESSAVPPILARNLTDPHLLLTTSRRMNLVHDMSQALSPVAWAPGACRQLRLVKGRCFERDRELVISSRTSQALSIGVGAQVAVTDFIDEPPIAGTELFFPYRYRVVGIYAVPDRSDPFWTGSEMFAFAPGLETDQLDVPPRGDAAFGTRDLLLSLSVSPVEAQVRRLLDLRTTEAHAVDDVEAALAAWKNHLDTEVDTVVTAAPALDTLTGLHTTRDAVRLGSYLLGLQLWLLIAYVLFLLATNAAEVRANDVALAKLRGLRTGKVVALGVIEPLLIVLLAIPLGVVAALTVTGAAVTAFLHGVTLRPDDRFWLGLLLAAAATAGATLLALVRALRQPLGDQLRRATPLVSLRKVLVTEVVVVTLAVAAFYQIATAETEDRLDGLALLAPGLAAVAVAVVAARLLLLASGLWARRSRARPGVPGFLAARQITRRRGGARVAVLAAVAVSLATFATATWEIAADQRTAQAAMEVGAHRVYEVEAASPTRLLNAVRDIDAGGGHVAAVIQVPEAGTTPPMLAVDAANLETVAAWRAEWAGTSLGTLARSLQPVVPPSLEFSGATLTLDVDGQLFAESPDSALVATVVDRDGAPHPASFGRLRYGQHTLSATTPDCTAGCRLARIRVVRLPGDVGPLIGQVTFLGLEADGRAIGNAFDTAANWRPAKVNDDPSTSSSASEVAEAPDVGVLLTFGASASQGVGLVRADLPEAMPVGVVGAVDLPALGREGLVYARALDNADVPAVVVSRPQIVPRLGDRGLVTDLAVVTGFSTNWPVDISYQVWTGPEAPAPRVLKQRLDREGLHVVRTESLTGRTEKLGDRGSALALLLLIAVAVAGLAIAALATLASALAQARRRAYELAALRTAGVGDSDLRGATMREYVALLGVGAACGLGSGIATALLAGPAVGLLGIVGPVAPVATELSLPAVAAVAAVSFVLFGAVAVICARMSLRFSRPELLREAPA